MTVICIHAYPAVRDVVARHWKHYGPKGVDRCGVLPNCELGSEFWPKPIPTLKAGEDRYIDGCNLIEKFVASCEWLLESYPQTNQFLIMEYDSLILGPVPECAVGIMGNVGICDTRWGVEANHYIASPWLMDRAGCSHIATSGRNAIRNGMCQNGSPDIFLGWLFERSEVPFNQVHGIAFTCNSRDMRVRIEEAVATVERGAWFVHGVKEPGEFSALLGARPPR